MKSRTTETHVTPAHRTGAQIFLDGPDFAADPRDRDYTPPGG